MPEGPAGRPRALADGDRALLPSRGGGEFVDARVVRFPGRGFGRLPGESDEPGVFEGVLEVGEVVVEALRVPGPWPAPSPLAVALPLPRVSRASGVREVPLQGVEAVVPVVGESGEELLGDPQ